MSRLQAASHARRATPILTAMLVVAALYLAQGLFLPLAMAALFTFLLAPVVSGLQRLRLPRSVAAVIAIVGALSAVGALGATVVGQLEELSESLPQYRETIGAKLASIGGAVTKLEHGLSETTSSGQSEVPPLTLDGKGRAPPSPQPVSIVADKPSPLALLGDMAGPVLAPLGTVAVVVVLVLFLLIYLDDLRDRIVRVLSGRGVAMTTQAASDVGQRISRYLLMNLVVNMTYGIPIGIGLLIMGIPNAFLWGLLATLLRFIPYLGPWLAAAMPLALSFAISPGWGLTVAVLALFLVIELICGNVIEPLLYGKRTGLSPLAIVVAAVFWTWLWGAIGLLLSVPLTLILVVSGRYIPQLRFLDVLFGDSPPLAAGARFYHRLVSKDADGASRIAEDYLEKKPLPELYDAVLLPAVRSLKHDASEGQLAPEQVEAMRESFAHLTGELPALSQKKAGQREKLAEAERVAAAKASGLERIEAVAAQHAEASANDQKAPAVGAATARVVFIAAGDDTDALVGPMLADVLCDEGIAVETLPPTMLSNDLVRAAIAAAPDVLVIGGLPGSLVRLRHLVTRARGQEGAPRRIIAGLWDAPGDDSPVAEPPAKGLLHFGKRASKPSLTSEVHANAAALSESVTRTRAAAMLGDLGADRVVHTLAEAAAAVRAVLQERAMGIAA